MWGLEKIHKFATFNEMTKDYFKGRTLVLATKHEKEKVMAEILEKELGVTVIVPVDFDTDQFGTFTREIKRTGDQLEAVRKKTLAGMTHTCHDLGIASEGSFGSHPEIPWAHSNFELVLLVDKENGIEIRGHDRSTDTNADGVYVSSYTEAKEFAKKCGFPEHGVIVRNSENGNTIHKGITTYEELEERVRQLLGKFFTKKVFIETDLRAHMNPTRMKNIRSATNDLVKNAKSLCPKCDCPGFVIIDAKLGLPCGGCGTATDMVSMYIYGCQKCKYEKEELPPNTKETAGPGMCGYCNP